MQWNEKYVTMMQSIDEVNDIILCQQTTEQKINKRINK